VTTSGYRGRLAPSPTGKLHFGVARTSLVAWLAARAAGGKLVLRIEDLDGPRVVHGAADAIMNDLRWLGLDWDEGPDIGGPARPYVQSQRSALYDAALDRLASAGRLFHCTCTRAELAESSSAPHGDLGPRYPGTCRLGASHPRRAFSLRFRMDDCEGFVDRVYGRQSASTGDDFIVHRSDGLYAYQLAVVVDDIAMGITEVVRGSDLLSSTPRQIAIHRATTIADYRAAGLSPAQVIGTLAATLNLAAPNERLLPTALIPRYDPTHLPREPTILTDQLNLTDSSIR
jgi:glutamyl-tRNA synthetase